MTATAVSHTPDAYSSHPAVQVVMRHVNGFNDRDVDAAMVWSRDALVLLADGVAPSCDEIERFERTLFADLPDSVSSTVELLRVYGDTVILQARFDGPASPTPTRAAYAFVVQGDKVVAEVATARLADFTALIGAGQSDM